MIIDARGLRDGSQHEADVCVIGAGAAGLSIAMGLRDSGLEVAVLVGGAESIDAAYQDLYAVEMTSVNAFNAQSVRARGLGGSTALWFGWCKPMRPEDFEERPWMPLSGWPITRDDLDPYYKQAFGVVDINDLPFEAAPYVEKSQTQLPIADSDQLRNEVFQYSRPTRLGPKYKDSLSASESVRVYLHASVTEIRLNASHDTVDHVVTRTLDGQTSTFKAKRFVLAAGGIENARILLASNNQIPDGVANQSGYVGRCFMEHPHYYRPAFWLAPSDLDISFYRKHRHAWSKRVRPVIRGVLSLSARTRRDEQLPSFTAELMPAKSSTQEVEPISSQVVGALFSPPSESGRTAYQMTLRTEQTPDPSSRITLDPDETDALGMPRARLHWTIREPDNVALRRTLEIVGANLASQGLGRLWTPTAEDGSFRWRVRVGSHHIGTTRMSEHPEDGVVDAHGRCHDLPNLYIAGSSVFPTGGDSNPTLTIVALAIRLAEHLAAEGASP